jgi:pregnancy-associated plasma protein-A
MRRFRLFAAAAAATAIYVGATVSPASAGSSASASWCAWNATNALFSTSSTLAARGAAEKPKEPSLNETYTAMPESAKGKGKATTVPLWFHVVSADGVTGNVTQSQIDAQMTVLNLAFAGFYGGANTGFKFKLAGVTRTTNAAWYNARAGGAAEREMKRALHRGGWETLNYYSTTADVYLGWAYLPGLPESRQYLDGIVVDWESMPGTSTRYAGRYDLGQTATHEAGHWFDLEHTFYGGCNAKGDFVDDTPAMLVPTSGCPEGKDTCPKEPGLDPIHNYMDYSYDACYEEFTPGQAQRMRDAWTFFRTA